MGRVQGAVPAQIMQKNKKLRYLESQVRKEPPNPHAHPAPMPTLETEPDLHPGEPITTAFIGQFVGLGRPCSGPHKPHTPLSTFHPLNTLEV